MSPTHRVLFVCMGNICRSPTAHGVFLKLLQDEGEDLAVEVDSAGTHGYHVGSRPDPRSMEAALRRGYDLGMVRARQVEAEDFERFDLVLAMDSDNFANLERIAPAAHRGKLKLFLEFGREFDERDVPDPYYGGGGGFERVLDLVEDAARGLLQHLRERQG